MKTVLTVSDSDCCAGSGIQADIKTLTMHGVYATSVITAVNAKNTMGVTDTVELSPEFLNAQLDAVFSDIYPDAVKIGMVSSPFMIYNLSQKLREYKAVNIVVDPVMVTNGDSLLARSNVIRAVKRYLLPLAKIITPNVAEAELIANKEIRDKYEMSAVAKLIGDKYNCAVLVKGGNTVADADDIFYKEGKFIWLEERNIPTNNTLGLGTSLASAIAANLAKGYDSEAAVRRGKDYITCALSAMLNLGKGVGPIDHMFDLNSRFKD